MDFGSEYQTSMKIGKKTKGNSGKTDSIYKRNGKKSV
jgi:hypothetical protein